MFVQVYQQFRELDIRDSELHTSAVQVLISLFEVQQPTYILHHRFVLLDGMQRRHLVSLEVVNVHDRATQFRDVPCMFEDGMSV